METPLGRISAKNGWWRVQISYNSNSRTYSYSVECADGVLRFTDRNGEGYTLGAGQRLLGAGSSARPLIQVVEMTAEGGKAFKQFSDLADKFPWEELSWPAFRAKMKPIENLTKRDESIVIGPGAIKNSKRPLMIEYVPRPRPVTTIRNVF